MIHFFNTKTLTTNFFFFFLFFFFFFEFLSVTTTLLLRRLFLIFEQPGLGPDGALSSIQHVSFDYMFAAATYVGKGVSGVRVEDCVGYKSLGSMFVVEATAGSANAVVRTLSVLVVTIQTHRGAGKINVVIFIVFQKYLFFFLLIIMY